MESGGCRIPLISYFHPVWVELPNTPRNFNLTQELSGKACLAGCYFFWGSVYNEITAFIAAFGTEVDDIVGTLDDIQIVLNHYQRMAPFYQGIEGMEQALDVVEVKTRGRLVEDEERRLLFLLTYEEGELYTLILTTRKRT